MCPWQCQALWRLLSAHARGDADLDGSEHDGPSGAPLPVGRGKRRLGNRPERLYRLSMSLRRLLSALAIRRSIALALLLGYSASSAEAAIGVLRDGAVHHESAAAAVIHQETHQGDHGHEDPGAGAEHGSDHRHGTSSDHCTHVHGLGLPSACGVVEIVTPDRAIVESAPLTPTGTSLGTHFRPPKS